jgi:hypothetical protein
MLVGLIVVALPQLFQLGSNLDGLISKLRIQQCQYFVPHRRDDLLERYLSRMANTAISINTFTPNRRQQNETIRSRK